MTCWEFFNAHFLPVFIYLCIFSVLLLLIIYYSMFWVVMYGKKFRSMRKIFRITSFTLGWYWSLFLFWVYTQIISMIGHDYDYEYYIYHYVHGIFEMFILSLIVSILFVLGVYMYEKRVK